MARGSKRRRKRLLKRRTVLKGITALGVLSAAAPLVSCGTSDPGPGDEGASTQSVTVYRFQTRKDNSCTACRNHQHYKVFVDEATAARTRAHPGCNCAVVPQQMPQDYWDSIAAYEVGGVIDLRRVFPPMG